MDGEARAYPLRILNRHQVVNDAFGGPLLVTYCPLCGSGITAERTGGGETLPFGRADDDHLAAGGSRWRIATGRAVDGPHEDERLAPATGKSRLFWFAWLDFHPDTGVYPG